MVGLRWCAWMWCQPKHNVFSLHWSHQTKELLQLLQVGCFALVKSDLKVCPQIFFIGLRSRLWLGHYDTFTRFLLNPSRIALTICLGSSTYWKVNLRLSLKSCTDWYRFCLRISMYLALSSFLSSLNCFPVPAAERTSPQWHMMLPASCVTVFFGWSDVLTLHQT